MKIFLALVLFSLSACAATEKKDRSIDFTKVMNLKIGSTSENEASEKIGTNGVTSDSTDYHTVNYYDPKTGYQRLSLNFDSETRILRSVLWIPTEADKEITLTGAQERFKGAKFVEASKIVGTAHSFSRMLIYSDAEKGINIHYNPNSKAVEALVKYDPTVRIPASSKNK